MTLNYLVSLKKSDGNKKLLLGFPFSGAVAQSFNGFKSFISADTDLSAIQYPGRGHLISEPLIYSLNDLLEVLYQPVMKVIQSYDAVCLYGHSLGALVAYELLKCFQGNNISIDHCHLNVGACPGPDMIGRRPHLHLLSDEDFWVRINQYGGTPQSIIEDVDLKYLFLPILKADFTVYESYQYQTLNRKKPLEVAINAFGGKLDGIVGLDDLVSWIFETSKEYKCFHLPGDHFFINDEMEYIVEKIMVG